MNAPQPLTVDPGLAGVVVGHTRISDVDGQAGALRYRGIAIDALVDRPFAAVASLVALGKEVPAVLRLIDQPPALTAEERALVLAAPQDRPPMQVLQGVIPLLAKTPELLALTDADLDSIDPGSALPADLRDEARHALIIASKAPEIVATHFARKPVESAATGYEQRFGDLIQAPAQQREALLDAFRVMQILQLEHSFNASTFAARVIGSTLAPIENALSGAVGTLHGVLHGGADQAALETADAVGSAAAAAGFVDQCLADNTKVMGMGHREYRVLDPRARYAKALAESVSRGTPHSKTFETLAAIEAHFEARMAAQGKALHANIEFYKGLIFRMLGLPPAYFTALFAMARLFGYVAHVLESRFDNRLIRPAARYIGP
ncbi:MAG: citrate/2-methylcitrate synthase [Pseudomonadota bacterium]